MKHEFMYKGVTGYFILATHDCKYNTEDIFLEKSIITDYADKRNIYNFGDLILRRAEVLKIKEKYCEV